MTSEPPSDPDAHRSIQSPGGGGPIDRGGLDQVIEHLFACGLDIASALSDTRLDDRAAERLRDATSHLDMAIQEIRTIVVRQLGDTAH